MPERSENLTVMPQPRSSGRWPYVLVLAGLFLCVVEVTFRVAVFPIFKEINELMYDRHPVFGHFNRPDLSIRRFKAGNYDLTVHTNRFGLRGLNENTEKELGGIWIGGDSNTFAAGVEDELIYSARLQNHGYWAANMATDGHVIIRQMQVMYYFGRLGYRPRAVLIALSATAAAQDYTGIAEALEHIRMMPLERRTELDPAPAPLLRQRAEGLIGAMPLSPMQVRAKLARSSAVYGWLRAVAMESEWLRDWTLRTGLRQDIDLWFPYGIDFIRPLDASNPMTATLESAGQLMADLARQVKSEFGVPFGVVLIPSHHQIYPQRFRRYLEISGLDGLDMDLDIDRPTMAMEETFRQRGVPVINLLPALRNSGRTDLVFPDDGHLTAPGHAIAAGEIAAWLEHELGIPPRP